MPAIGGSPQTLSIAGREFRYAADADPSRKIGGLENEVQMNGDGSGRLIRTRVSWAITGNTVEVDNEAGDHEFLVSVADGKEYVDVAITYSDGSVWVGSGIITGELTYSAQSATASFDLGGPGTLKKL